MERGRSETDETRIFFGDVETKDAAADRYRTLAMQWHPDRTPDPDATVMMAMINTEYRACLRGLADGTWGPLKKHSVKEQPRKRSARQRAAGAAKGRDTTPVKKTRIEVPKRDADRFVDKAADLALDAATILISAVKRSVKRRIGGDRHRLR